MKSIRTNELRHIAKEIASQSDIVILEDLKAKNLTKTAKETVDNLGEKVKQKSVLNLLASRMETIKTGRGTYHVPLIRGAYALKRQRNTSAYSIGQSCM